MSNERKRRARQNARRLRSVVVIAAPTVITLLVAVVLMSWHVGAPVRVDAVADSVRFRATDQSRPLIERSRLRSIVLRGIDTMTIRAASVSVADSARYDVARDTYGERAWIPAATVGSLKISKRQSSRNVCRVMMKPAVGSPSNAVVLDRLWLEQGTVKLARVESQLVAVDLARRQGRVQLQLPDDVIVTMTSCDVDNVKSADSGDEIRLRIRLAADGRLIEVQSTDSGLYLVMEPADKDSSLFGRDFSVVEVALYDEAPGDQWVSTLQYGSSLSFPAQPNRQPIPLGAGTILQLGGLREFFLRTIASPSRETGLVLAADGHADTIKVGPTGGLVDRRPTLFDALWNNPVLTILLTIATWSLITLTAVRKNIASS